MRSLLSVSVVFKPEPEQEPPQPRKLDPDAGNAVSVKGVFRGNEPEHVPPQMMPPGTDDIVPEPGPNGTRVSTAVPNCAVHVALL